MSAKKEKEQDRDALLKETLRHLYGVVVSCDAAYLIKTACYADNLRLTANHEKDRSELAEAELALGVAKHLKSVR